MSLECLWCKYLKFTTTLTDGAIVYVKNGSETVAPRTTLSLPICDTCKTEHRENVGGLIRQIQAYQPDLKEWLSYNPKNKGESFH